MELLQVLVEVLLYGMASGADSPKIPLFARLMLMTIIMAIPIVPFIIIGFAIKNSAGYAGAASCWAFAFIFVCLWIFMCIKIIKADRKFKKNRKQAEEQIENEQNH